MSGQFTPQEVAALQLIQEAFPLTSRPFADIGAAVGLTELQVIALLADLKQRQILKEIRGIFDARFLGFQSALVAFQVDQSQLDAAVAAINAHPGVSHNYRREHWLNLWFTLSAPNALSLEQHVERLAELSGCSRFFCLRGLRTFKRLVRFSLDGDAAPAQPDIVEEPAPDAPVETYAGLPDVTQRGIMQRLQHDLPLIPQPFAEIAQTFGLNETQVFDFLAYLRRSGKMPRFAGILRHRQIGYIANAMAVWQIPADRALPFAEQAAALPAVSHCYERVTFPDWPYNLYTMIHGRSRDDAERVIQALARQFGVSAYEILYSTDEYKKQRVDYFSEAFEMWEKNISYCSGCAS
ncbi:transcriptional regulators [Candidatus Moduliflexus flocculans]|uniref:siroheme decarboxylase n=1 Tax=Candidatus Moduliflexus flocculans TaxID=1499966 RepID=A0A0S6VQP1_9BACT|nr:transcriptional regulators [Candidatus Moduliflexus flocculans]